jgi:putative membrane protein
MIQFDEEGIQKLTSTLDGDVSSVIDRIDAVFDAGDNYSTFTKLADGQEGRVKFIIRTGSVK